MIIQRFEFSEFFHTMDKNSDGDYCLYDDHEAALSALTKERDQMKAKLDVLEKDAANLSELCKNCGRHKNDHRTRDDACPAVGYGFLCNHHFQPGPRLQ